MERVRADMEARSGVAVLPQLFLRGKFVGAEHEALQNIVYLNDNGQL